MRIDLDEMIVSMGSIMARDLEKRLRENFCDVSITPTADGVFNIMLSSGKPAYVMAEAVAAFGQGKSVIKTVPLVLIP